MNSQHGPRQYPSHRASTTKLLLLLTFTSLTFTGDSYTNRNTQGLSNSPDTIYRSPPDHPEEGQPYNQKVNDKSEDYIVVFPQIEISEIEETAAQMSLQLRRQFEDRTRFDTLSEELMSIPFDITVGLVRVLCFEHRCSEAVCEVEGNVFCTLL
jgi:hypothetical protein